MVITAHFIDDDWNLHKRILNFCQVANHKGDIIGRAIEKCLEGWGIDRLFTVTVDNASSNDVAISYLVKKFKGRNGLVLDGEFIHIRCSAHILNLIVSDALKDLHVSIIRIRNAVKYVRSSPAGLQIFKDFAKEDIYLPKDDIPTTEDWDNAKVFVKFLKTFSEVTMKFSASMSVTSNIFHELCLIQEIICEYSSYENALLSQMTLSMQTKFNKYWRITTSEKTNLLLYVSVVLDPRYKLAYVNYCFNEFLEEDYAKIWTNKVEEAFHLLTWWKVNSSQFKIISQVARDIYSIPISTVPSESAFSTGGRMLDSLRSSLTPQTAEALICAQNWIQSKPLDDMTEEIDRAEEIDEGNILFEEMEAAFENLNNDSMV
ncbi:putative transposase [Cucumis melo var. makuwa]|uniref:Transposase n=1 Tax=Cucumis melo var. makuwa TaxID=1194695 RepID=A0A5A7UMQ2_CUCMM|nr:putative transposase [Cucumis melo var. makuwa]